MSDPSSSVRERASGCLTILITLQTRLDPLCLELVQGIKTIEDASIKVAMFNGLLGILQSLNLESRTLNISSKEKVQAITLNYISGERRSDDSEALRFISAKCFAFFLIFSIEIEARKLFSILLNVQEITGVLLVFIEIFEQSKVLHSLELAQKCLDFCLLRISEDDVFCKTKILRVFGLLLKDPLCLVSDSVDVIVVHVLESLESSFAIEVRIEALHALETCHEKVIKAHGKNC